jgi:hypothetical protein
LTLQQWVGAREELRVQRDAVTALMADALAQNRPCIVL